MRLSLNLDHSIALKPRQKKTKLKEAMEDAIGSRVTGPLESLGDRYAEFIKSKKDNFNLSTRGNKTSRRLYAKSNPFTVRDLELYI